jgi:hypothetical protein
VAPYHISLKNNFKFFYFLVVKALLKCQILSFLSFVTCEPLYSGCVGHRELKFLDAVHKIENCNRCDFGYDRFKTESSTNFQKRLAFFDQFVVKGLN